MKTIQIMLILLIIGIINLKAGEVNWNFDKSHTKIQFSVPHMIISDVIGNFTEFDGKVITQGDNFENAIIEFTVETKSINTENQKRDDHLRGDDFFNAEKFPKIIFKATSMKKTGKNKYKLSGNFTMRDITKKVTFDVKMNRIINDPWGNTRTGLKLTGKIDRFDYNLKWTKSLEGGELVVGREVEIICNVELIKQK